MEKQIQIDEEDSREERKGVRDEMNVQNSNIYITTRWVVDRMAFLWLISLLPFPGFAYAILPIPVFGLSWVWAMVRADFLIHRIGSFLKPFSLWENSWQRHHKKIVLFPFDAISMVVVLFFMAWGVYGSWMIGGWWWKLYAVITALIFLVGLPMIGWSAMTFEQAEKRRIGEKKQ